MDKAQEKLGDIVQYILNSSLG